MQATALWHLSPTQSALRKEILPTFDTQQVQIKSRYSLISTGTEKLVATGKVPAKMYTPMKVPFMDGNFNFPVKYGYSLVGEILTKGKLEGQLVHLLHPHQDFLIVDNESIDFIPREIPAKRAALASNVETALNAIWDSGVTVGDKVLVSGFGMIGGLVARLLTLLPAVAVVVLEKNEFRCQMAQQMGFEVNPSILKNFDISFHTSSTSEGLQTCIESVGMEGKIVELSWYGTKSLNLQLGGNFHYQRKQIISSQVSQIPFQKNARWNYRRRKEVVWELLKNPVFDVHITHEIPFKESPAFFGKLRSGKVLNEGLGWVIRY